MVLKESFQNECMLLKLSRRTHNVTSYKLTKNSLTNQTLCKKLYLFFLSLIGCFVHGKIENTNCKQRNKLCFYKGDKLNYNYFGAAFH